MNKKCTSDRKETPELILNAKCICLLAGSTVGFFGLAAGLIIGHMIDLFISVKRIQESDAAKVFEGNRFYSEKRNEKISSEDSPDIGEARLILGVDEYSKPDEIRRMYRKLAAEFHPDTAVELDDERKKQLSEAFLRVHRAYERVMKDFPS